jgi:hypothetical protein
MNYLQCIGRRRILVSDLDRNWHRRQLRFSAGSRVRSILHKCHQRYIECTQESNFSDLLTLFEKFDFFFVICLRLKKKFGRSIFNFFQNNIPVGFKTSRILTFEFQVKSLGAIWQICIFIHLMGNFLPLQTVQMKTYIQGKYINSVKRFSSRSYIRICSIAPRHLSCKWFRSLIWLNPEKTLRVQNWKLPLKYFWKL